MFNKSIQKSFIMNVLQLQDISAVKAGTWQDVADAGCATLAAGTLVYYSGALTNWWNPVGWVCTALSIADLACVGYGISQVV